MFDDIYRTIGCIKRVLSAPDISVYAVHCIRRRRHLKRRLRQYGRIG